MGNPLFLLYIDVIKVYLLKMGFARAGGKVLA